MSHRRLLPTLVLAAVLLSATSVHADDEPPPWWSIASSHHVIMTNADPERGMEIAASLELFRGVFARLAPALELRSPAPTKIIAFRDGRSYAPYKTRPDGGGTAVLGQFLSHPDGNFLTLDAGTRLVGSYAVIFHEYVHYFVRHNFPGVPLWFNEGLAEYYSTFAVEGETLVLGRPVERHLAFLAGDEARRARQPLTYDFSLADVLETGQHSSDYHSGKNAGAFYALSWALVHYLLAGDEERLDQMADFLVRLEDGDDPDDAFEEAFGTTLGRLEEKLRAYVRDGDFPVAKIPLESVVETPIPLEVSPTAPASVLYHLGDLQVRLGSRDAAEEHFRAALDLDSEHPEAHAGLALIYDWDGRLDEAEVLYRDAIDRGSRDPLTWVRYGRHLFARIQGGAAGDLQAAGKMAVSGELAWDGGELGPVAEAKNAAARAAFTRAIELDGDFAEAYVLFGFSHLFGEVAPEKGIRALEKAHDWLPLRYDVTFYLLQLHLKAKDFDAAEKLLAGDLERYAPDEVVLQAREEVERSRLLDAAAKALDAGEREEALRLFDEAIAVTTDPGLRQRMSDRLLVLQDGL